MSHLLAGGSGDGVRREVEIVFDLMKVLCVAWVKTTVTWNKMEYNFIGAWLDGGHEADEQGEYVFFVVNRLEVVEPLQILSTPFHQLQMCTWD